MTERSAEDLDLGEASPLLEETIQTVKRLGLPLPARPEIPSEDYILPSNIGELPTGSLSKHLAKWANIATYAQTIVAMASIQHTSAEVDFKRLFNKRLAIEPGDKVTEKKAGVMNRPEVQELEDRTVKTNALYTMVAALLDGYDKKYSAISREISLREKGTPREERSMLKGSTASEIDDDGIIEEEGTFKC